MDRKNDVLRLMDGAGYKKIIIACDSYKGRNAVKKRQKSKIRILWKTIG